MRILFFVLLIIPNIVMASDSGLIIQNSILSCQERVKELKEIKRHSDAGHISHFSSNDQRLMNRIRYWEERCVSLKERHSSYQQKYQPNSVIKQSEVSEIDAEDKIEVTE